MSILALGFLAMIAVVALVAVVAVVLILRKGLPDPRDEARRD